MPNAVKDALWDTFFVGFVKTITGFINASYFFKKRVFEGKASNA